MKQWRKLMPKLSAREDHSWVRPDRSPERLPKGNRWNGKQRRRVEGSYVKDKNKNKYLKKPKKVTKGNGEEGRSGERICWYQKVKPVPIWHFEKLLAPWVLTLWIDWSMNIHVHRSPRDWWKKDIKKIKTTYPEILT